MFRPYYISVEANTMRTKTKEIFSTGEAARILGIQAYRVTYAHAVGAVKEPERVFGRRAYRWADLCALAKYFGVQLLNPALTGPGEENDNV